MSIEVISMWYNEAVLAPLFFRHYRDVAAITLLIDGDTDDQTMAEIGIAQEAEIPVRWSTFRFNDGLDDALKSEALSYCARESKADWVLCVDADEFAFCSGTTLRVGLEAHSAASVLGVAYRTVYRHHTDGELWPHLPPLSQRTHGDPRKGVSYGQSHFIKPAFVRPSESLRWSPGHHYVDGTPSFAVPFDGAHWCMADPDLAIARRMARRRRMSTANYRNGYTVQHWHVTEAEIREECARHLHDPQIIDVQQGIATAL